MTTLSLIQYFILKGIIQQEDFEYIDALDDDSQNTCDVHDIDFLPHLKVYGNDGIMVYELIKEIPEMEKIKGIIKNENTSK